MADLKLSEKEEDQFLLDAKDEFETAFIAMNRQRDEMLQDLEFSFGINQWDSLVADQRARDNRPALTIDRIGDTIKKRLGSIRRNRPSIKVIPVEGGDEEVAEIYTDLIREIEYASSGQTVYMTASDLQLRMGYGVIGVEQTDNEYDVWVQSLALKRYPNPFVVYFDPQAQDMVARDGRFAYVSEWMTKDQFEERWPDSEAVSADKINRGERSELWYEDSKIRVLRGWRKVKVTRNLALLSDGRTVDIEKLSDDEIEAMKDEGITVQNDDNGEPREREVEGHDIVRFNMNGAEILDGPEVWPGKFIPLIPVYGEEIDLEGRRSYRGITRTAKDPQRLYNYARTTMAEVLAEQPRAPWIMALSQLNKELKAKFWNKQNISKTPYLVYDDETNPNPPTRVQPPVASQGYALETQQAAEDIQRTTGTFDPSLGAKSNETSGIAIATRIEESDLGTVVFTDHLAESIEHTGRILVDLIPHFYDTQRALRLRGEDDVQREVTVNEPVLTPKGPVLKNDLARGKYDVRIAVGPSFKTRQVESVNGMISFVQAFPQSAPLIADLIAKNMDWPGSSEIAERLRSLVPPGILDSDDPEKQEQLQRAEAISQKLAALEFVQGQSDVVKTRSEAQQIQAETRETQIDTMDALIEALIKAREAGLQDVLSGNIIPEPEQGPIQLVQ